MAGDNTEHRPERGFAAFLGVMAWVLGIFLLLCFALSIAYFVLRGEPG